MQAASVRALVAALVREKAKAIVVHDRDAVGAAAVVMAHAGSPTQLMAESGDVASAAVIGALVARCRADDGDRVDLFCSNAGVMVDGGVDVPGSAWNLAWSVNVLPHVHAAHAALPGMLRRGSGHFLNVASAAGLLTAPGAAPYAVTKHAAVGFAEWLAITHGSKGIGVTLLCPESVDTAMLKAALESGNPNARRVADSNVILTADAVATAALDAVKADVFLVTPHPKTLENTQKKWADVGRWLKGMRRFLEAAP